MITFFLRYAQTYHLQHWLLLLLLCGAFMLAAGTAESAPLKGDVREHIVQAGETLSGIAQRYRVDLRQLASYNGITNLNQIRVGQRLRIPPASLPFVTATPYVAPRLSSTPVPGVVPRSTPTPSTQSVAPAAPARSGEVSYIVYSGDSLTGIGARFGVSVSAIMARNRLPSSRIYVGQRLIIPVNTQAPVNSQPAESPSPTPIVEFQTNLPSISNQETPPEPVVPTDSTDSNQETLPEPVILTDSTDKDS